MAIHCYLLESLLLIPRIIITHHVLVISLHFVDNGTSIAVAFLISAAHCQQRNVLHFKYAAADDGVNTVYLSIKMMVVLFFSLGIVLDNDDFS